MSDDDLLSKLKGIKWISTKNLVVHSPQPAPKKPTSSKKKEEKVNLSNGLVDWGHYMVRSELGSLLAEATKEKFRDHLNHFLLLVRQGTTELEVSGMEHIDWHALIADEEFQKGGKFDPKLAADWFKAELTAQIEKVKKDEEVKASFAKNMAKVLHHIFDSNSRDVVPRGLLIEYALRELDVPMNQHDECYDLIENYLEESGDFGVILGPSGGTIRLHDASGKETKQSKEMKARGVKIHMGKIERAPRRTT
jgi:hypothetical protein